jgi:hypothetical protein
MVPMVRLCAQVLGNTCIVNHKEEQKDK